MKVIVFLMNLLSLGFFTIFSLNCFSNNPKQPNVVLFLADDMELDYLSCFGGDIPTPNIDRLATEGIRFLNASISSSACTPSRYALLTGKYAGRCEHPDFLKDNPSDEMALIGWNTPIAEKDYTLARLFSQAGYYTGFAGKWHVGVERNKLNLPVIDENAELSDFKTNQKLQQYQLVLQEEVKKTGGFDEANSVLWENYEQAPLRKLRYHNFEWITKGAVDFIENAPSEKPFFLYVASTAIHGPDYISSFKQDPLYTLSGKINDLDDSPSRKEIRKILNDRKLRFNSLNLGMIQLDEQFAAIYNKLKEKKLDKNTIIIFLSDHNREPGKGTCYEKGVKVPLLIKWPDAVKAGCETNTYVQSVDIFPTLNAICNVKTENDLKVDGKSFLPLLNQKKFCGRDNLFYEFGYTRAISDGKFKYIAFRYPKKILNELEKDQVNEAPNHLNSRLRSHACITIQYYPGYFDQDQLYDLKNDPYEQRNLAKRPEYEYVLRSMKNRLDSVLHTMKHPFNLKQQEIFESDEFKKMKQNTIDIGTDHIPWWKDIPWPPQN